MRVAQLRHVLFERDDDGYAQPRDGWRNAAFQATRDVAEWLGFAYPGEYLDLLPRLRRRIFEQAAP